MKRIELSTRDLFICWKAVCYWNKKPFSDALKSRLYDLIKLDREYFDKLNKEIDEIMYK